MYGSPIYQINTATLGLHAEYPLFETYCHRLLIRPVLGYSSNMRYTGDFGKDWRLNYAAFLRADSAAGKVFFYKGSGQPAVFAMSGGAPPDNGRYLPLIKGTAVRLAEYANSFVVYNDTDNSRCRFARNDGDCLPDDIFDAYGNRVTLIYDKNKHLTVIRDSADREITLAYNARGLCESFSLPDGRECRMEYNDAGFLSSVVNFAGIPTRFDYENGLLSRITHGKTPRTTIFAYQVQNNVPQIASVTNPDGGVTRYSRENDRVRVTTPAGRFRLYKSRNGLTESVITAAGETLYSCKNGKRVAITDKNGAVYRREYDSDGRLSGETLPGGAWVRYSYDAGGYRSGETWPQGETVRFVNNNQGDPEKVTYPDGGTLAVVYNEHGMPVRETRQNGCVYEKEYDRFGNMTAERDSLGTIAAYEYDSCGYECTSITDGEGRKNTFQTDALGRLTAITDPEGTCEQYRYNCCAETGYSDGGGNLWHTERDAMSRAVKFIDPAGGVSAAAFDPDGIPAAYTDENGNKTKYKWDAAGFRTEMTDAADDTVRFAYDRMGNATSLTDEAGNTSRIDYSANGMLDKISSPLGRAEQWRYDAYGRTASRQTPAGAQQTYAYGVMGELRSIQADNERSDFTWDAAGNLLSRSTSLGIYTANYDMRGRVVQTTAPDGMAFAYAWNNADQPSAVKYPDGFTAHYEYDVCGRPSGILFDGGGISFAYDAADNLVSEQCLNGVTVNYSYDACKRMTELSMKRNNEILCEASWQYDPAGNLLHEDLELALLTDADVLPKRPFAAEFDADNQLSALNGTACQNSRDGNITRAGELSCQYNSQGKLISRQTAGGFTAYTYGIAARPAEVRHGDIIQRRYYGSNGRMLYRTGVGAPQRFIWSGGLLAAAVFGDKTLYYHRDRHGNILLITDQTGEPVCAYAYHPFGEKRGMAERIKDNPFTFMGALGVTDEGEDVYLTGKRAYHASLGRFMQPDPLLFADGCNRYRYARNNPLRYVDPAGGFPLLAATLAIGSFITVTAYYANEAYELYQTGKAVYGHASEAAKYGINAKSDWDAIHELAANTKEADGWSRLGEEMPGRVKSMVKNAANAGWSGVKAVGTTAWYGVQQFFQSGRCF